MILNPDLDFEQSLKMGSFTITSEFSSVRGVDLEEIKENAKILKKLTNGINVGNLQGSNFYLGSLATCHILKDLGLSILSCKLICRDKK